MAVSKTSDHSKIMIKMSNPNQEPPLIHSPMQDLEEMDILCTFRIKIEIINSDQDAKPQSGTSSFLQSPKSVLKGHGYSLHLNKEERVQKF